MKKIAILGATSAIAIETARLMAADGHCLFLVARNPERLNEVAEDLRVRGAASIDTLTLDLNDISRHEGLLQTLCNTLGGLDLVLVAHGTLGDQKACEARYDTALREITTNFLSVLSVLTPIANYFESGEHGHIAVISSVAGDRARQSNYIYGTAKGAVSLLLQGLRNRLSRRGVTVTTIKPGFVDTPMTASFRKNFLFSSPERVGRVIYQGLNRKKDIVYAPGYWRWILFMVKAIPEKFFKHLKL